MSAVQSLQRTLFPDGVQKGEARLFLWTVLVFLGCVVLGVALDALWLFGLPLAVLVLYFLLSHNEVIFWLIVICTPFSFEAVIPGTGSALQVPTEPLIFAFLFSWALESLLSSRSPSRRSQASRYVRWFLGAFLGVLAFSLVTSGYPVMSAKMFANVTWYILAGFLYVRKKLASYDQIGQVLVLMFIASSIVAVYTLIRHGMMGFEANKVNISPHPFFTEHGSYAAYISIVFGVAVALSFGTGGRTRLRVLAIVTSVILFFAILFSYTRAAWMGVALFALLLVVTKAKHLLRFRTFVVFTAIALIVSTALVGQSIRSSIEEQATSVGDIERNQSNLERFNRWMAAIRMIQAHPIVGVGLGTYPIEYAKYKDIRFQTSISDFYGWAHNDYLQYFAETGIFGLLFWLLFLLALYVTGLRTYFRITDEYSRNLILGCLGGMITYLVHAFFNDFLIYDKVAVPFWICAALVVIMIDHSRGTKVLLPEKAVTYSGIGKNGERGA